ncbi:hypothetical protein BHM03_00039843 [Ensete ventricosum]|nr:hypothetical protein BHM03_00039843 [Ensete ventricosum]
MEGETVISCMAMGSGQRLAFDRCTANTVGPFSRIHPPPTVPHSNGSRDPSGIEVHAGVERRGIGGFNGMSVVARHIPGKRDGKRGDMKGNTSKKSMIASKKIDTLLGSIYLQPNPRQLTPTLAPLHRRSATRAWMAPERLSTAEMRPANPWRRTSVLSSSSRSRRSCSSTSSRWRCSRFSSQVSMVRASTVALRTTLDPSRRSRRRFVSGSPVVVVVAGPSFSSDSDISAARRTTHE